MGCAELDTQEPASEGSFAAKNKPAPMLRFNVVQHNVGGGAENGGGPEALAYTFAQIEEKKPDAVMLEEVCAAQLDAFKARFPGWAVRYAVQREKHEGCANGTKGNLLASLFAANRLGAEEDVHAVLQRYVDVQHRLGTATA